MTVFEGGVEANDILVFEFFVDLDFAAECRVDFRCGYAGFNDFFNCYSDA